MDLTVFASGSAGNCLVVRSSDTRIMIDAGISHRRMTQGLAQIGVSWHDIDGVLITHEHSDHISGLKTLLKKNPVPVLAPYTVSAQLAAFLPEIRDVLQVIPIGEAFHIGEMKVRAFHTSHDTKESVGYRLEAENIFAMATDLGCVTDDVVRELSGADAVLIEANHDKEMLRRGSYPAYLKKRILSPHGHLSNDDCARLAGILAEHGTRQIVLGHLSRENNRPGLALETVRNMIKDAGVSLFCASQDDSLSLEIGG